VTDTDEILVMTASGVVIRTPVSEIRIIGRGTKGVRIMRLDNGDRVIGVAFVQPETDNGKEPSPGDEKNKAGTETKPSTGEEEHKPDKRAGPAENPLPRPQLRNPQESYRLY
ncbi:MAG: hypothetical protein LUQ13_04170, partial [Methanomicrobiales archaeon]|nr:hypothetical protein [Methanomicrobiales archaeon]